MGLTVLVNAGPWLPVPPAGYGGIENVVATLVPALRERGVRVLLCAVGESTLAVDELHATFPAAMFEHITGPYNAMMGIAHAHMGRVQALLRERRGEIDLVHDHLEVVGPSVLAALGEDAPPVLQTLHWDLRKHPDFYAGFDGGGRIFFNAVSDAQLATAPANLRAQALGAIPLGVDTAAIPFRCEKGRRLLVLARITEVKGTDVAARLAHEHAWELDLAGPVAGALDPAALPRADQDLPDVRFFRERVAPLVDGKRVRWLGTLAGAEKLARLGAARALLCPLRWDEPGGTAVVEALACGTPVVGLRRGALPMLVQDGVTGFLADDEAGLAAGVARVGELDPAACRRAAEERFSARAMAREYERLYGEVLARAAPRRG